MECRPHVEAWAPLPQDVPWLGGRPAGDPGTGALALSHVTLYGGPLLSLEPQECPHPGFQAGVLAAQSPHLGFQTAVSQVLLCTSITKKNNPIHSGSWYKENITQAKFFIVFAFFFSSGHERIFKGPELQCALARQVAPPMCLCPQYRGGSGASAPPAHYPHCKMQRSGLTCHRAWPNLSSAYKTCHHFCPRTRHSACGPLTPAPVPRGHTLRAPQPIHTHHSPPN